MTHFLCTFFSRKMLPREVHAILWAPTTVQIFPVLQVQPGTTGARPTSREKSLGGKCHGIKIQTFFFKKKSFRHIECNRKMTTEKKSDFTTTTTTIQERKVWLLRRGKSRLSTTTTEKKGPQIPTKRNKNFRLCTKKRLDAVQNKTKN